MWISEPLRPHLSLGPSGGELLQIAGVRMVLDYGNHSFADFRNWTNGKHSPCYSLMTTAQDKKPLPNFPQWLWHVVPVKEFKRYAENGSVDHRINSFSCWAPFPPGAEGSARFYEIFIDPYTSEKLKFLAANSKIELPIPASKVSWQLGI